MPENVVAIGADLSQLRRELAKLPNLAGDAAQKTLVSLERAVARTEAAVKKSVKQAQKPAKDAAQATDKANDSLKGMGETAGDTESSIRAISGALGFISPEAEAAANTVAELGGAFEGVTKGVGILGTSVMPALGVAVVAVSTAATIGYGVWQIYTAEERLAERATIALATAMDAVAPASERVAKLALQHARATGKITDAEYAFQAASAQSAKAAAKDQEALQEKYELTEQQIRLAAESLTTGTKRNIDGMNLEAKAAGRAFLQIQALHTAEIALLDDIKDSAEASAAARVAGSRRVSVAVVEEIDNTKELAAQLAEAAAAQAMWNEQIARLEFGDQLVDYQQRVADLSVGFEEGYLSAQNFLELQQEAESEYLEWQDEQRAAAVEAEEAAARATSAAWSASYSERGDQLQMLGSGINAIADLQSVVAERNLGELEEGTKAHAEAAKKQFKISKGLAIVEAIINGAQAAMKSLSTLGPPVPPNVMGIAGMAVVGAANVAAIATIAATPAPSFHTGGMVSAPDERTIQVLTNEAVLNSRATSELGEAGVNAMNDGKPTQPPIVVVQKYKHRVFDSFVEDNLSAPGSPLGDRIRANSTVGHRRR